MCICFCSMPAPAAAQSSPCPPAASTGTQPGQGMPGPFWNAFAEKFDVALAEALAARWLARLWLCSAGSHVVAGCDSVLGVQLPG